MSPDSILGVGSLLSHVSVIIARATAVLTRCVLCAGLDSIAAPFLVSLIDDEAAAFVCFSEFLSVLLPSFFRTDNPTAIQVYLAVFQQLLAFHFPGVATHLAEVAFVPELYAIPWFLTMFTRALTAAVVTMLMSVLSELLLSLSVL